MVTEHNNMTATKMKRIEAVEIEDNKDDDFDVIEDCVLVEAVSLYDEGLYEEYSDLIQDSQVEKKQKTKKGPKEQQQQTLQQAFARQRQGTAAEGRRADSTEKQTEEFDTHDWEKEKE